MKVKNALAALPLVLNACGSEESSTNFTPNELGQGIWEGGFSNSPITITSGSGSVTQTELTQIEQPGVGLYTSDNKVFFYDIDNDILYTNDSPGFVGKNIIFGPHYYISGNEIGTTEFDGNAYISTKIKGSINTPFDSDYLMVFDDKYFRGADLNWLEGMWSYTEVSSNYEWNLDIASDGSFTGTTDKVIGCTFSGAFSTIDSAKNEYSILVTLAGNCAPHNGSYTGLAATIDTVITNDTLLMAIYEHGSASDNGFFMKPVKQP